MAFDSVFLGNIRLQVDMLSPGTCSPFHVVNLFKKILFLIGR